MSSSDMIEEFLKKSKVTVCPDEEEDPDYEDHRRTSKSYMELHLKHNLRGNQLNGLEKRKSVTIDDPKAFDNMQRIKLRDKEGFIGMVMKDESVITDFDLFESERTGRWLERYVATNGKRYTIGKLRTIRKENQ